MGAQRQERVARLGNHAVEDEVVRPAQGDEQDQPVRIGDNVAREPGCDPLANHDEILPQKHRHIEPGRAPSDLNNAGFQDRQRILAGKMAVGCRRPVSGQVVHAPASRPHRTPSHAG